VSDPLGGAAPDEVGAATPATFVFADIAGFTALTEAHGDEQAAELVAEFCRLDAEQLRDAGRRLSHAEADACEVRGSQDLGPQDVGGVTRGPRPRTRRQKST
jgi:class 3 adenylate cyclase